MFLLSGRDGTDGPFDEGTGVFDEGLALSFAVCDGVGALESCSLDAGLTDSQSFECGAGVASVAGVEACRCAISCDFPAGAC
jgi:hypothetical protein